MRRVGCASALLLADGRRMPLQALKMRVVHSTDGTRALAGQRWRLRSHGVVAHMVLHGTHELSACQSRVLQVNVVVGP